MDGRKALCLGALLVAALSSFGHAATPETPSTVALHDSRHFQLYTDLEAPQAEQALDRMEAALALSASYWRAKPRGKIRCYLVESQTKWKDSQLPHPLARISIEGVGGATVSEAAGSGRQPRAMATIYASLAPGVLEHEVVHAYCLQAFGATGPDWYKEGMAEVLAFRGDGASGVQCPESRLAELRGAAQRSIVQVVGGEEMTNKVSRSLQGMLVARTDSGAQVPISQWTARDAANTVQAREDYLWSWALCHLLVTNPNYAARFRQLGESYLSRRDDSFQRAFGSVAKEIEFEYQLFLENVGVGYRSDLCAWDWQVRFRAPGSGETVRRRVLAARGYQPSGLTVTANRRYKYQAEGAWSTASDGPLATADGSLVGAIMSDYQLGEPFILGAEGTFTAPATGNLYLRCADAWNQLHDNRGEMRVQVTER